jgi:hypothetical protein
MAIVGASFIVVTDLRDTRTTEQIERQARPLNDKPLRPTDVFEDMNYNAAFITEDVLFGLQAGTVSPSLYALEDARWRLMPRSLSPNKPISSAETITLYPEVAARGTNITFPLKANIMMHSGLGGYHLDWLVVMASQLAFLAGIAARNRRPNVFAFGAFFFGCAFALVARGGILNARLLDQIACLALAYMSYRLLLWVQNVIWARNQLQTA